MDTRKLFLLAPLACLAAGASAAEWSSFGPRSMGMGGAGVALSQGPLSVYWNPAGLGEADNPSGLALPFAGQLSLSGPALGGANDLYQVAQACASAGSNCTQANINTALADFGSSGGGFRGELAAGLDLKLSKLDVFVNNFAFAAGTPVADLVNATPATIANNGSRVILKGLNATEFGLGYGHETFLRGLLLGADVKGIAGRVGYFSDSVINNDVGMTGALGQFLNSTTQSIQPGVDAGLLWDLKRTWGWMPLHPRVGVTGRDLNNPEFSQPAPAIQAGAGGKFTLERTARAGVALSPLSFWNFTADADLTRNVTIEGVRSQMVGVGTEINVFNRPWLNIPLRAGVQKNTALPGSKPVFTGGLGLNFLRFNLDAAVAAGPDSQVIQTQGQYEKIPNNLSAALQLSFLFGGGKQEARPKTPTKDAAGAAPDPKERLYKEWRRAMAKIRTKPGCYAATYPDRAWKPTKCAPPPKELFNVGSTFSNNLAQVGSGSITSAAGSFPIVQGLSTESSSPGSYCSDPISSNVFTLQLNTNVFDAPSPVLRMADNSQPCAVAGQCKGWVQFIFSNGAPGSGDTKGILIEYWLHDFLLTHSACPVNQIDSGKYNTYFGPAKPLANAPDCVTNSVMTPVTPQLDVSELAHIDFIGSSGGGVDEVFLGVSTSSYKHTLPTPLGLDPGWTQSEFNVFGGAGGRCAIFNSGTTLEVQQSISGTAASASNLACGFGSTTSEMNNLSLSTGTCLSACVAQGNSVEFTESNVPNPVCPCPTGQVWNQTTQSCKACPFAGQYVLNGVCVCAPGKSVQLDKACGCPPGTVYDVKNFACQAPPCPATCPNGCWPPEIGPQGQPIANCKPTATPGQPGTPKGFPKYPKIPIPADP